MPLGALDQPGITAAFCIVRMDVRDFRIGEQAVNDGLDLPSVDDVDVDQHVLGVIGAP